MANVISEHLGQLGLVLLLLFVLLYLTSESLRTQVKKGLTLLLIGLGAGLGYYLITGESPTKIPGNINEYFSDPQLSEESSHRYYKDPVERYGDQLK
jgi:hypothetical protein